ncbi:MAG: hypothetical protein R6U98_36245, partial [Pirellulaceae bacterium]
MTREEGLVLPNLAFGGAQPMSLMVLTSLLESSTFRYMVKYTTQLMRGLITLLRGFSPRTLQNSFKTSGSVSPNVAACEPSLS